MIHASYDAAERWRTSGSEHLRSAPISCESRPVPALRPSLPALPLLLAHRALSQLRCLRRNTSSSCADEHTHMSPLSHVHALMTGA